MLKVIRSKVFHEWLTKLRDLFARRVIARRLDRLALGNPGDVKPVGEGVSELRIKYGPGYRVYVQQRGETLIIVLVGGDKSTQAKDIERAKKLAENWSEEDEHKDEEQEGQE